MIAEPLPGTRAAPPDPAERVRIDPATPCAHCGLPVGRFPVGRDPVFCCSACHAVYAALAESGLADTYYRLRDVGSVRPEAPARTDEDSGMLVELSSPGFLERHTVLNEDGTRSAELFVDGVHCAACVWLVERMPIEMDGVHGARLDLARARLKLRWDPEVVDLPSVSGWLSRYGYSAHPSRADGRSGRSDEERRLLLRMGAAWSLAANVMLIALAVYAGFDRAESPGLFAAGRWVSLALAVPAIGWAGSVFFRRAWASVRRAVRDRSLRGLDMDTPIALGLAVGFVDSARATVTGAGEVWFDSLTLLVAALLTARFLQVRSRRLAGDASDRLLSLVPTMARRILGDGTERHVSADELAVGDRVRVHPGEVVPVDGTVARGESRLDNAVVTGESRPEAVSPGTKVLAGSTNVSSVIDVVVEATGEHTRVGRLLAWVRDASSRRAPVVQLADRLSGWFVATVLALAAVTFAAWSLVDPGRAVSHVVALLVVTCPCALGMATPLAMAVAVGRAARSGLFVKSEAALELLTRADTVLLDKTGTLTVGRPAVMSVAGDEAAVILAAAVEAHIPHPIARAFLLRADRQITASDVRVEPGAGVEGVVDGRRVVAGRPDWVSSRTAPLPPGLADAVRSAVALARTPVAVAVDGRPVAVVSLGDAVRPDARPLLDALRASGVAVEVLSGDHAAVVADMGRTLGLPADAVRGGVSPEDKRDRVNELRAAGRTVVMVGDGVNDAAALAEADVGIAVSGGTGASLVAADVFATGGGLETIGLLFDSSRRVMRVIRRNLGISLAYNVVVASLAIAGRVDPLVAAVAMPVSSLAVVLSSILQRTFRPREDGAPASSVETVADP
jgi:Cu2+-exporting ATPase